MSTFSPTESPTQSPTFFGEGTGGGNPVDNVLARYSALDGTEIAAITAFVDGLVADGHWNGITEIYAPCLNATDYLIGMKSMTLVQSEQLPIHTPGEYVEFQNNSQHFLDPKFLDEFATIEGFMGVYNVFTGADTADNSDLFGVEDATQICYYRWRGNDTNDFDALYNVTLPTPRTTANLRPTGDFVGQGYDGSDQIELQPAGVVLKIGRIANATVPKVFCQWHGHNNNGTPSAGDMANSRYSLMMHSNGGLDISVRGRVLQFLRDIGVTGIPIT